MPDVAEMAEALTLAVGVIGPTRLWANPDCGLKTRGYAETEAALRNLVAAAGRCGPGSRADRENQARHSPGSVKPGSVR